MKIKTMASSVVCCIVLSGNTANALEKQGESVSFLGDFASKDERVVLEDCVIKKAPSQIAAELKVVSKDTKLEVVDEEGNWAKVVVGREIGFIELEKIKRINAQVSVKYLDGIEYLDVYSDMSGCDSKKIGRIRNNEKIFIEEELGQYIRISWNGKEGYIENIKDCIVKKIKKVVKEDTKIYSGLTSNALYKKISEGAVVEIEEVLSEYYKVKYKGEIGYIGKDNLKEEKYVGDKNLNAIKLYVKPDDFSDVRTYIPSGSNIEVISYEGEYAYVEYGEYEGYIRFDSLSKEEITLIEVSRDEVVSKKIVDRDKVVEEYNVLQEEVKKGGDYEELFNDLKDRFGLIEVSSKRNIEILKNRGNYYEVLIDGNRYYMNNSGIDGDVVLEDLTYIHSEPKIETKFNTRYVNQMDVEVYKDKNKKDILGILIEDSQVELVEDLEGNMSRILINGSEMYIETDKLTESKMYRTVESEIENVNTGKSHKLFVEVQDKKLNTVVQTTGTRKASIEELAYYSNPKRLSVWNSEYKYQYLRLDEFRMINAKKLNDYLNSIPDVSGKKNVFKDKADVFISSAKKYNIDPVYLVAHTLLETGKGKSDLAQGQDYEGKGKVYNLFGIGAVDSDPLNGGKATAYKNGWTSIDKAIEGSAKWLSDNYINLKTNPQNTLYKMRYNYMTRTHQYATDIAWAGKISKYMNELSYLYEDSTLIFEVPVYNSGTYLSGVKKKTDAEDVDDELIVEDKPEEDDKEEVEKSPVEDKPEEDDKEEVEKPPVEDKPEEDDKEEVEKPPVEDGAEDGVIVEIKKMIERSSN